MSGRPDQHVTREGQQPLLHDGVVALRAPSQIWLRPDGAVGEAPIDGYYLGDIRLVDRIVLTVGGHPGEHIATEFTGADTLRFVLLFRGLDDDATVDTDVRGEHTIVVRPDGLDHAFRLVSRRDLDLHVDIVMSLGLDHSELIAVKAGIPDPQATVTATVEGSSARWGGRTASAEVACPGADVRIDGAEVSARWDVSVPALG